MNTSLFKRFFGYCWHARHEFFRYAFVGGSSLVLDMITLIAITRMTGFEPVFSVFINQVLVISYNFTLNKYWSFKNKHFSHKQVIRYGTLLGANYVIAILFMFIFNSIFGFDYRLVRIASVAASVAWNFYLYRHWVFYERR